MQDETASTKKRRRRTRPGQADIARILGISTSTVSRALADSDAIKASVREQVRETARQVGYPTRGHAASRGAVDRIVVFTTLTAFQDARGSIYFNLLGGIKEAADATSADVATVNSFDESRFEEELGASSAGTTGCIFLGVEPSPTLAEALAKRRTPAVVVNGIDQSLSIDSVSPANFFGGSLVASYLLERGHRRFVYLAGPNRMTLELRLLGFTRGLGRMPADDPARLVEVYDKGANASAWTQDGFERVVERARRAGASAIFAFNDNAGVFAIEALKTMGLSVPADMSVMGFDDLPIAELSTPGLTTFRIDWTRIGRESVQLLRDRLSNPDAAASVIQIGGEIVTRGSVQSV